MKAYKITTNDNGLLEEGRYLCPFDGTILLLATCTKPQAFFSTYTFKKLCQKGCLEEVELENIKWIHPHLYNPIKKQLLKAE